MKKKIISLLLVLALCLGMTFSVSAEDAEGFANDYCRVQDMAGLMTDSEEAKLNDILDELSIRQKMDVVVVTTNTLDEKTVQEYADDIYDYGNFGYGQDKDGILLLISLGEENDCYISTCGYGITAFTDAGIKYISKEMTSDLKDENYFSAFQTFSELCDEFITQARNGKPYDRKSLPKEPLSPIWILISLGVGVVLSLIIVGKIAVVCDMQAECLHNRLTLDNLPDKRFICINNKKLSVCSQLCHIIQYISKFFFGIFPFQLIFQLVPCTFFFQRLHCLILVHTVQTCNNFVPRLVHYMNASAVDIKYNIISIVLVLMNHNRYPFLSLFFKFFLIRQMTAALKPLPACHTYSLHLQISLICCVRKSDFLLYKKSCMLTDRMSGILRIRPSLLYCSESVYSMF